MNMKMQTNIYRKPTFQSNVVKLACALVRLICESWENKLAALAQPSDMRRTKLLISVNNKRLLIPSCIYQKEKRRYCHTKNIHFLQYQSAKTK